MVLWFCFLFTSLFYFALRPGGPHHRNAAAPGAISLRSMAPAKAAFAATVIFFCIIFKAEERT